MGTKKTVKNPCIYLLVILKKKKSSKHREMNNLFRSLALLTLLLPASLMASPITPTTIVGFSYSADDDSYHEFTMAQSFTTDANAWTLSGVTLALANPSATSQGAFAVGLYTDNAGSVGSLIGSLTTDQTSFFTESLRRHVFIPKHSLYQQRDHPCGQHHLLGWGIQS